MSWQNLMWPGEAGGGAGASRVAAGAAPAPWQCARACNEGSKVRFHHHREGPYSGLLLVESDNKPYFHIKTLLRNYAKQALTHSKY